MKANTPLEQLMYNTNDIKMLKEKIHEFYNCNIDLGNTSVSVAVSNTNLPTDIKDGYIVDINGNVYKFIAFDTDATTAYIEYYTTLKGADGKDGADDIDDTTTANNKLWSSQKTYNEILNVKGLIDKGAYITFTQPTPEDATYYTLLYEDIDNLHTSINPENEDLIIYIDGDGKAKELYKIYAHLGDYSSFTLVKVADIGGEKKYKHNVLLKRDGSRYYDYIFINNIVNNSNIALTYSDITDYLNGKFNYDNNKPRYKQKIYSEVVGWTYDSNNSTYIWYNGVNRENATTLHTFSQTGDGSIDISSGWTIEDTIIPL